MYLVTSDQMRCIEERAFTELGIPPLLLMENAAMQTVKHALRLLEGSVRKPNPKVVVVCGGGNNGGDGLAAARLLYVKGIRVQIVFIGDENKVQSHALTNLQITRQMDIPFEADIDALPKLLADADLVIDALLGTGLRGPLLPKHSQTIDIMNCANAPVLTVDIPSGVDADNGKVSERAVRAHTTITFGLAKIGLLLYPGAEYAGNLIVEDISIPQKIMAPAPGEHFLESLTDTELAAWLPKRPARSNKGTFGRVCVLAGSRDMPGAAVLCCKAAYKAGAGLVHACSEKNVIDIIQNAIHEAITTVLPTTLPDEDAHQNLIKILEQADVIVIGPGLGRTPEVIAFVRTVLYQANVPVVIDADALTALDANIMQSAKAPWVITPHPGEMAALTGLSISEITGSLVNTAQNFARTHNVVTLLKDARTVITSPCGRTFINTTGNSALAKAGSGDVLAGVLAGFIAQGMDVFKAAVLAAHVHGKAGELAAASLSTYGVLASEIIEHLPNAYKGVQS